MHFHTLSGLPAGLNFPQNDLNQHGSRKMSVKIKLTVKNYFNYPLRYFGFLLCGSLSLDI
jgi:hypothetical protein